MTQQMPMPDRLFPAASRRVAGSALAVLGVLAGCASPNHRAPVEDRRPAVVPAPAPAPAPVLASEAVLVKPTPLPGAENAGKPGYYTVKPGDTLIRIGLEHGQNWRDVARWNGLDNANVIEVGQVLRVVPPSADASAVVVKPVVPAGRVETRAPDGRAVASPGAASAPATAPSAPPPVAAAPASPSSSVATPAKDAEEDLGWIWPANGQVAAAFEEGKNKGLAIAGKAGDPVLAAADGRVVYAGSGLRGYGNLIIVKHNATFLTAYAHNQALLVKEDQAVRKGQKIAEMGSSDSDRVQLHFEIRRQGKPIDPARLLPAR
jgi:lipoprotein NlpD